MIVGVISRDYRCEGWKLGREMYETKFLESIDV